MATKNLIIPLTNNDPNYIFSDVRYARIDNTGSPVFTVVNNVVVNPFIVQNVDNGQYIVYVTPHFSDGRICPEQVSETPACIGVTAFNVTLSEGSFVVTYTCDVSVPDVKVNVNYPNGGFFSSTYTNNGNPIIITPPAGVYGDFTFTMQPVCDPDTGWVGTATAPAVVNIANPPNSQLVNETSPPLTNVSGVANDGGSQLLFVSNTIEDDGVVNFFLADGTYTSIVVYFTGAIVSGNLVTGSGTYAGVVSGGQITFSNVVMLNGAVITLN